MSTNTPAKRRRSTTAKKAAAPAKPSQHLTVVDMRKPLPVRRGATGPHTPQQLAEARAALAAAYARLPIPVINWQTLGDGRTAAYMADDTLIVHTAHRAPVFAAYVICPEGRRHEHRVTDQQTLHAARAATKACTSKHDATDDQYQAVTDGVTPPPPAPVIRAPKAITPVKVLAHAIRDTQPTNVTDLRAADADTAKEHPDHA